VFTPESREHPSEGLRGTGGTFFVCDNVSPPRRKPNNLTDVYSSPEQATRKDRRALIKTQPPQEITTEKDRDDQSIRFSRLGVPRRRPPTRGSATSARQGCTNTQATLSLHRWPVLSQCPREMAENVVRFAEKRGVALVSLVVLLSIPPDSNEAKAQATRHLNPHSWKALGGIPAVWGHAA
jgi:hypothetical protein